jgi:hypothetical protein
VDNVHELLTQDTRSPAAPVGSEAAKPLRYEIKMICQETARASVQTMLRVHGSCLTTLHPPRRVQSLYLDTHDGRSFEEAAAGVNEREKFRLRWYGDESRGVECTLERKVRRALLGWKDTVRLPGPIDVEGADRYALMRELCAAVPPGWADHLAMGLEPAQITSYWREYYTTADGRIRITVDTDLCLFDQRHHARIQRGFRSPTARLMVVEWKAPQEHLDVLRRATSAFPLMVDKCSKFMLASDPDMGPAPSVYPL